MNKRSGILFVVTAASGTGKTSLVNALIKTLPAIKISVSYTTRPKRSSEKGERDYHFVSQDTFEEMINQSVFLEYAHVFSHYYGTSKTWVDEQLASGIDVILEIDWQGAGLVLQHFPNCVSVFVLPPSLSTLKQRLQARQQDDPSVIAQRLTEASKEIAHYKEFDYLIVNDDFKHALAELRAIVVAERLRQSQQRASLAPLLAELIKK